MKEETVMMPDEKNLRKNKARINQKKLSVISIKKSSFRKNENEKIRLIGQNYKLSESDKKIIENIKARNSTVIYCAGDVILYRRVF